MDASPIGGVSEPDGHLSGVVLGLTHALSQFLVPSLGLGGGELGVAILQHVIRYERLGAATVTFDAAQRDWILAPYAAALDYSPACRFQGRIDMLGAGFGFIHFMIPVTACS